MSLASINNLQDVEDAIEHWNLNRGSATALNSYVSDIDYFEIDLSSIPAPVTGEYLHVYPGVVDENLENKAWVFYLLDDDDNAESTPLFNYIGFSGGFQDPVERAEIPDELALARITNWTDEHEDWIDTKVTSQDGVFQAYLVPFEDLNTTTVFHAYFALIPILGPPNSYEAELIIYNPDTKKVVGSYLPDEGSGLETYSNTVRIVPPFSALEEDARHQDNFYLLNQSYQPA